jgi:single-strand DNA-binding protein
MARGLNQVLLIGNIGQDPEVRITASGTRVANFSLATSRQWNKDGEKQEKTEWHRCTAWEKLAEIVEKYVRKGDKLFVDGRIEYGQYEDKEGVTRYTTTIVAQNVIMLGEPKQLETEEPPPADEVHPATGKRAVAKPSAPVRRSPSRR